MTDKLALNDNGIVDKCYDLVENGCFIKDEYITEIHLLHEAIASMSEESKNKFYARLIALEEEGFDSGFTDDDGNPISDEEQERANHMEDRINKGEI